MNWICTEDMMPGPNLPVVITHFPHGGVALARMVGGKWVDEDHLGILSFIPKYWCSIPPWPYDIEDTKNQPLWD